MTDIIVRLEQRYEQTAEPECDLIQEAALVIDRLHDELADVRADAALLRADNERLRAALQEITDLCKTSPADPFLADNMERLARRALEPKP